MAKRIALGLLVLAAVTGFAHAQDTKVAISLDTVPLIRGFIYANNDAKNFQFALAPAVEILVHPHFTVGGNVDMYFGKHSDVSAFYMGIVAHGRYYPMASGGFDKFFLDAGLGFSLLSIDGETEASVKGDGFVGLTILVKAGYKLMFTRSFFVEPSIAYVYAKTGDFPTPIGWQPGLTAGIAF